MALTDTANLAVRLSLKDELSPNVSKAPCDAPRRRCDRC